MDEATLDQLSAKFAQKLEGEHVFRGVLHHSVMLTEGTEEQKKFDSLQMSANDCIVATYPKSGTTWMQEIVWLIYNGVDIEKAKQSPLDERCPFMEIAPKIDFITDMQSPKLLKTHLLHLGLPTSFLNKSNDSRPRIVYVARNPKDVAVSFYHFYRSNKSLGNFNRGWNEFFEMFISGYVVFGDWFSHVITWYETAKKDSTILFIKYEDMKRNSLEEISKIAKFLGKDISTEMLETLYDHTKFESMKKNPMVTFAKNPSIDSSISPFLRKGEIGDWKNYFTVAQNERFMDIYNEKMKDTDLSFQFE
ncbi:unnamed protein product [Owenia fusiformis]|uniref:Uncharacterized protein n=1 Tax=Owenia fusiformis TaxID=6347 RepID=A0A8J1UPC9_OWEFU|nr:unnamed protein product [Owenia fusiformis]